MDIGCRELFAKNFSFWKHLTQEQQDLLCASTASVCYPKGTVIHSGSEDCVGVLLVKRGQLRTYLLSENGRDVTLYRLFADDVCVLSASCVLEAITFDVFIDAEEDTEIFLINSLVFRRLAEENIYVKCFGYELATTRFSDVMWAMQQILFMGVDRRLAIFLLDESAKTDAEEIRLTHEQIARYMGSAREVVTRMLKYLAGEGAVELSRGGIRILSKEKLRALAAEDHHARKP